MVPEVLVARRFVTPGLPVVPVVPVVPVAPVVDHVPVAIGLVHALGFPAARPVAAMIEMIAVIAIGVQGIGTTEADQGDETFARTRTVALQRRRSPLVTLLAKHWPKLTAALTPT